MVTDLDFTSQVVPPETATCAAFLGSQLQLWVGAAAVVATRANAKTSFIFMCKANKVLPSPSLFRRGLTNESGLCRLPILLLQTLA